jgi:beta-phosphoglucomutase-like phosphatase (HAD superfamily)
VIAFEDSENGLRSALAAGISDVVITVNDYTADHDFAAARVVLDGLGEPDAPVVCQAGAAPPQGLVDLSYLAALASDSG